MKTTDILFLGLKNGIQKAINTKAKEEVKILIVQIFLDMQKTEIIKIIAETDKGNFEINTL